MARPVTVHLDPDVLVTEIARLRSHHGTATLDQLAETLDTSRHTIWRNLQPLVESGRIEVVGRRSGFRVIRPDVTVIAPGRVDGVLVEDQPVPFTVRRPQKNGSGQER